MKAVLEMEMYRRGGGGGGGGGVGGVHRGPHRRPGQCQGARTEVIHISLSGDKTATPSVPPTAPLVSETVRFFTSSNC